MSCTNLGSSFAIPEAPVEQARQQLQMLLVCIVGAAANARARGERRAMWRAIVVRRHRSRQRSRIKGQHGHRLLSARLTHPAIAPTRPAAGARR